MKMKMTFKSFCTTSYSPVSDISLTSLQETMDRLQSGNENDMNEEEYTLNLEEDEDTLHLEKEDEEEDVMIQEDYEVQSESLSDVPDTNKVDTRELMCITLTLKKFQHTYVDGH